jgi:hypothetical protein
MVDRALIERLVRNFPENGLKVMLEDPANVRDVLDLLHVRCVGRIDFGRMEVDPTHFVAADYRHLAADLVLRAPLRAPGRGRARWLTIYFMVRLSSRVVLGIHARPFHTSQVVDPRVREVASALLSTATTSHASAR